MFGRKNNEGGHFWADFLPAENPTFPEGTPVTGSGFTGTVTETRLAPHEAEVIRVEFDPGSPAAIEIQQGHGYFFASDLTGR